ncbi:MAG: SGNH/GDSL hydrolase family protein, partial [Sedimentisphaerales bacterium]|nr:SGNH/GDSL hydrolase family protein [Sedimentisphaerales bacterium]
KIANDQIRHISFDEDAIICFEQTLQFALKKGIHVILLHIPIVDLYNQAEPEKYRRAIELLQRFSSRYNQVTFLDYSSFYCQQYELFYDPIHLNPQGQRLVTEKLAQDLKLLLLQTRNKSGR